MKLNLGSGSKSIPGFVNVDKFPTPVTDVVFDLETTPWPWESDSVEEIHLIHALEHMGKDTDTFLNMIKELYRICRGGAQILIHVPHPRHDNYLGDPTHVRPITPQSLSLFDRSLNEQWLKGGTSAATPLAVYLNVDFYLAEVITVLDHDYYHRHLRGELNEQQLNRLARESNNVISEFHIKWVARKSGASSS